MAIMSSSFGLVKTILVSVIAVSIIGSIAQLVASLFALGSSQELKDASDRALAGEWSGIDRREISLRSWTELAAVIMLIMALVCFTFELIGIIGAFRESMAVMSVFGVVMCLATIISCFTGSGGLKFLIILLNMTMTSLTAIYIYLVLRKKEMDAFRQRNSMSISVINDMNDRMSHNNHNNDSRKISSS